ncbi:ly6/PLAUR domain-containing protein 6 [Austrofundulus limnaeus]|uniref:Ly6/PLAUR domain-containing protein 6 n=1 Tax=Austrofundulus limnaeus TaxID=52670 RepID=A0A2I4BEH2_AUSLI|nr:PREDICTED: ly6/PLAUR domain-containing protein 6-like [Austrofundulus limnaeus]
MDVWPTVVWILVIISDRFKTVQTRDFTMQDIVQLHPSTTPHPGSFKCFTCRDAADNYECNRWAPDVYCPKGTRFCHTLHMMDERGDSVSVTKRCAALDSCRLAGCVNLTHNGFQVCTSCCEGNICNVLVPRNDSSAVFSTSALVGSGRKLQAAAPLIIIIIITSTAGRD